MPLCFGQLLSQEPRKWALCVHSPAPLAVETVPLRAEDLASAAIALCVRDGERQGLLTNTALKTDALVLYTLEEEGGYMIVAENLSPMPLQVARAREEPSARERARPREHGT